MNTRTLTAEQLALREDIRTEYPFLVDRETYGKKITNAALGSKNAKRLLKHHFPSIAFKCSSEQYANGSTIAVSWDDYDDAPDAKEIRRLLYAFSYSRFDGMTDSSDYDRDPWREAFRDLFGSAAHVRAQADRVTPEQQALHSMKRMDAHTAPAGPSPRRSRVRL